MTCTTVKKKVYIIKNGKLEERKQKTHLIKESVPIVLVCHRNVLFKVLCTNGLHHLLFGLQYDLPNLQGIPLSCKSSLLPGTPPRPHPPQWISPSKSNKTRNEMGYNCKDLQKHKALDKKHTLKRKLIKTSNVIGYQVFYKLLDSK